MIITPTDAMCVSTNFKGLFAPQEIKFISENKKEYAIREIYHFPFSDEFCLNHKAPVYSYPKERQETINGKPVLVKSLIVHNKKLNFTTLEYFKYKNLYHSNTNVNNARIEKELVLRGLNSYLNIKERQFSKFAKFIKKFFV